METLSVIIVDANAASPKAGIEWKGAEKPAPSCAGQQRKYLSSLKEAAHDFFCRALQKGRFS